MAISDSKQRVVFSLEKELVEDLKKLADQDRRTVSSYIGVLIEDRIKEAKEQGLIQ